MQCEVHNNPHDFLLKDYGLVTRKKEKDNTLFETLELLADFLPNPIPSKLNNVNSIKTFKH